MTRPARGCSTCRDRHISCDRSLPACLHCVHANRHCKGYGMRLSWPKVQDRKRAMLGKAPPAKVNGPYRIVNTSNWDIEIHYYLTSSRSGRPSPARTQPVIPTPMSWQPLTSETDHDLLQYFKSVASQSLNTVGTDHLSLRNLLLRVALSNGEPASAAVLQSVLAFSSLCRHGPQPYAAQLKLSALSTLSDSAKAGVGVNEAIPHVAAGMLLCCFEIQQQSESSPSQWLCYISGAKNVLRAARIDRVEQHSDMTSLIYWLYYHDVMAQFSLHHAKCHVSKKEMVPRYFGVQGPQLSFYERYELSNVTLPCSNMLNLASEAFGVLLDERDLRSRGLDHKNLLTVLEWKIRNFPVLCDSPPPGELLEESSMSLQIFQLALLVYLERVSDSRPLPSSKMRSRIARAFSIFSQLESFRRQLPLLILGCEARTDADRAVILDLILRTEQHSGIRSLGNTKCLIQSLWAQDDLAERDLDYMDKINAVLGSSKVLPAFV